MTQREEYSVRRGVRPRWVGFVRRYGWRAYALPILSVVTVAVLVRGFTPASGDTASAGDRADRGVTTPSSGLHCGRATLGPSGSRHGGGVHVEGLTGAAAGFRAGSDATSPRISLGSDITSCARNTYPRLVLVSISRQHLWACDRAQQVDSTAVTTGRVVDDDQTPLGSWRVQGKQRDRYLVGPGYRDYVHYWVPFNGDFGLHDAPWQTMAYGSAHWRTHGSHGCVHLPEAAMAWMYHWAIPGRTIVTIAK